MSLFRGFKKIFSQAGNGGFDTEAAFRIDLIGGKRVILVSPHSRKVRDNDWMKPCQKPK